MGAAWGAVATNSGFSYWNFGVSGYGQVSEPQSSAQGLPMNVRQSIHPTYKATRQTLAERRAADHRRQLERMDPPLAWVLSGPPCACCPEMEPER